MKQSQLTLGGQMGVSFLKIQFVVLFFALTGHSQLRDEELIIPVAENEIKIMAYNLHNLFDAEHDEGKRDFEFLPITHPMKARCFDDYSRSFSLSSLAPEFLSFSDNAVRLFYDGDRLTPNPRMNFCAETNWTDEKIEIKIRQKVRVIDAQGDLPDILVLSEVENEGVVGRLARALGYPEFYMTESPDRRGIELAVLYRTEKLTPIEFRERELKKALYPTRNISVAHFRLSPELGGGVLAVFPNHWPSQGNPVEARLIAARAVRRLVNDSRRRYQDEPNYHIVVTGDFNTIDSDSPHPIETVLLDPRWRYSLLDVRRLAEITKSPVRNRLSPGTFYYATNNQWNELDKIFVDESLFNGEGLVVDPHSYRIHTPSFATREHNRGGIIPYRYNHRADNPNWVGYSDHFAVLVKLSYLGR